MKIHQLRNATILLTLGQHRLLVDPMLSEPGALPGFKMFGGGRKRNPLVPLPAAAEAALASATAVVITHEHPDHFDRPGLRWVRERGLPVWASAMDTATLGRKGLAVSELTSGSLGMQVETVRSRHGRGPVGWLMGPVAGYYLAAPDEPSVYLVGDSVLTDSVMEAVKRLQPDVIVAPAGSANMGLGGNILFSVDELVALSRAAQGKVVLNHLEALDHCPTTREALRARMLDEQLLTRVFIPDDGEELTFERPASASRVPPRPPTRERPGMQKWVTARFAGT